jgi:hypothetical protein
MSLYILKPLNPKHAVELGYDAAQDTYFLQVHESGTLKTWLGHGLGGSETDPRLIVLEAARFANAPETLEEKLREDRGRLPAAISGDKVTYVGVGDAQYRFRPRTDSTEGLFLPYRIDLAENTARRPMAMAALAILADFLDDVTRALQLHGDFAEVLQQRAANRSSWLLNESDLAAIIRVIELENHLHWDIQKRRYTGLNNKVSAEDQRNRAATDPSNTIDIERSLIAA